MGYDPYDFDIAIPSGGKTSKGNDKGWGGQRRDDSDDESASGSGSDSASSANSSEISLSDSEDLVSKKKNKNKKAPPQLNKEPSSRSGAARGDAASGTRGSNALDKAKSFLSKYSTKTTPTAKATSSSARSRRLEMSLDDEDFSLDSSGEEIQKSKTKSKGAAPRTATPVVHAESSDLGEEDTEAEESVEQFTKPVATVAVTTPKPAHDQDSDQELYDRPLPVAARTDTTPVKLPKYDSESDDDGDVGTFAPKQTLQWTAGSGAATVPSRQVVEEEEDDEVESIASQSESFAGESGSVDVPQYRTVPAPAIPAVASLQISAKPRQISAVSESGVYEDDDFEHDSAHAIATPTPAIGTANATATTYRSREEESNFDYSLDFTEDPEPSARPEALVTQPKPIREEQESETRRSLSVSSASSSSSSKSNRNSYVDDGEDEAGDEYEDERRKTDSRNASEQDVAALESTGNETSALQDDENYSQDYGFESTSMAIEVPAQQKEAVLVRDISPGAQVVAPAPIQAVQVPAPVGVGTSVAETARDGASSRVQTLPPPAAMSHPQRSRVVIVREYEQDRTGIETRDASTQFTGNHAGIQTDLMPDGMFSSAERRRHGTGSQEDPTVPTPSHLHVAGVPSDQTPPPPPVPPTATAGQPPPPPPPPPPSPFSTYGLYDPLQLPVATSMSIYKQQLMALQQQIHQKKMDTERLFRDRIASRYSSLRGTDKYLAANRPTRMPLWEALVRVDPSLDEHKAKEIARLAGDAVA